MKKHTIFIMAMVLSCGLVFAQENPKKEKEEIYEMLDLQ